MSSLWLFALAIYFAYLARKTSQFRRTSGRTEGEDPLSAEEQIASRPDVHTGADGIAVLHWAFILMAIVCAKLGAYLWFDV